MDIKFKTSYICVSNNNADLYWIAPVMFLHGVLDIGAVNVNERFQFLWRIAENSWSFKEKISNKMYGTGGIIQNKK